MPSVTYRVWPLGWWCQAVRAPGENRTWAQPMADCSSGLRTLSICTVPVNQSAGPGAVWPPLCVYFMLLFSLRCMLLVVACSAEGGLCQFADLDERLDGAALVHGRVGVGDVVEVGRQVKDLPRVDLAVQHGLEQLRLVVPGRRRAAAHTDVAIEGTGAIERCVVRNADAADDRARLGDRECRRRGVRGADALE